MPARIRMMPTSISSPSKPACRPATSVPTAVSKYANKNSTDALFSNLEAKHPTNRFFYYLCGMKRIIAIFLFLATVLMIVAQAPQGGRRVLFIGDSVTDGGWGRSGGSMAPSEERNQKDLNHIFGHGYMEMCAAHFLSICPQQDLQFFNRGISGNTLDDLKARWQKDALDLRPDVVSILVGTNDADKYLSKLRSLPEEEKAHADFDYEQWKETYRQLIAALRRQNPKVRIVLGTPFVAKAGRIGNRDDYSLRESIVKRLAQAVAEVARQEDAVCIPYHEMFAKLQLEAPRPDYWIWDGIHPTTAGHRRMADLWIECAGRLF